MSYDIIGVRREPEGWVTCEDCKEPVLLMQQGKGTRLICDRCGWSIYTSTQALQEWLRSGRAEFPLPPRRNSVYP